jgi:hypothetical protein
MNLKRTDVLTVVSVVTVLLLLGLVAMQQIRQARQRSKLISCHSNLHHVSLSFRVWAHDNDGLYPMQVGHAEPGIREDGLAGRLYKVFQVFSNELSVPKTLTCPADDRTAAVEWGALVNSNISYTLGLDATEDQPDMILASDRNLAIDGRLLSGFVPLPRASSIEWTREVHGQRGNLAPAGGAVYRMTTPDLREQLDKAGDATNRLVFPQ